MGPHGILNIINRYIYDSVTWNMTLCRLCNSSIIPWCFWMNGNDHEPDMDGDTITAFVISPRILSNPTMLSNTSFRNRALLQPLQSGVFPYPVNCNDDIFLCWKLAKPWIVTLCISVLKIFSIPYLVYRWQQPYILTHTSFVSLEPILAMSWM